MDDRKLEQLARELGRDATDRIDPDSVARHVLERLRTEPETVRKSPWSLRGVVKVAAAAVLVVATTVTLRSRPESTAPVVPEPSEVAYALEALSDEELGEMLDSLALDAPMVEVMRVGFYDLDENQLENLLESLEE